MTFTSLPHFPSENGAFVFGQPRVRARITARFPSR